MTRKQWLKKPGNSAETTLALTKQTRVLVTDLSNRVGEGWGRLGGECFPGRVRRLQGAHSPGVVDDCPRCGAEVNPDLGNAVFEAGSVWVGLALWYRFAPRTRATLPPEALRLCKLRCPVECPHGQVLR